MTKLWKSVLVLWAIGMGLAMSAPALAVTTAVGPYYATPSWDQTLPAATRFIVLTNMGSAAVLDRETGLVWERSPSSLTTDWFNAFSHCSFLNVGNRMGWRVPSLPELLSLVDASVADPPLPTGHPFVLALTYYWSATSADPTEAWDMGFFGSGDLEVSDKTSQLATWCVRGGQGVNVQ